MLAPNTRGAADSFVAFGSSLAADPLPVRRLQAMIVALETGDGPVFSFSSETGEPVKLLEVRITEIGAREPSWWLVHEATSLEEAVLLNIVTAEESEKAGVPIVRRLDNDLEALVADIGVVVTRLKYGQVPPGLRQHGSIQPLKRHHLYQLLATGSSLGELEFFASTGGRGVA